MKKECFSQNVEESVEEKDKNFSHHQKKNHFSQKRNTLLRVIISIRRDSDLLRSAQTINLQRRRVLRLSKAKHFANCVRAYITKTLRQNSEESLFESQSYEEAMNCSEKKK